MKARPTYKPQRTLRLLSSSLLISLLLLLTGMNYFLYDADRSMAQSACSWSDEDLPANPAGPDEKSGGNPVSFSEEYVHDSHSLNHGLWLSAASPYFISRAEKLCAAPDEILSPPPELG